MDVDPPENQVTLQDVEQKTRYVLWLIANRRPYAHFEPAAKAQLTMEDLENRAKIYDYLENQRSAWSGMFANAMQVNQDAAKPSYQTLQEISQRTLRDSLRMIPLCALCYRRQGQQSVYITIVCQPRIEEQNFLAVTHFEIERESDAKKISTAFFQTGATGSRATQGKVQVKWLSACQLVPNDAYSAEFVEKKSEVEWASIRATPVNRTCLTDPMARHSPFACGMQFVPARFFPADALDPVEDIRYQVTLDMPKNGEWTV